MTILGAKRTRLWCIKGSLELAIHIELFSKNCYNKGQLDLFLMRKSSFVGFFKQDMYETHFFSTLKNIKLPGFSGSKHILAFKARIFPKIFGPD